MVMSQNDQLYEIKLIFGKYDLYPYVRKIHISNDINNSWPIITIKLLIEFKKIILDADVYGQEKLILEINIKRGKDIIENVYFELAILESNVALIDRKQSDDDLFTDYQPIILVTVPIHSINRLSATANYMYETESGGVKSDAYTIIKNVLNTVNFDTSKLDERGSNSAIKHRQYLIPPMSINKIIPYVNKYSGIYDGPLFYYCHQDGVIQMWNMAEKFKDKPIAIIHNINSNTPKIEEVLKDVGVLDSNNAKYVTASPIRCVYHANSNVIKYGYQHINISHPSQGLYSLVVNNVDNMVKNSGLVDKSQKLFLHSYFKARRKYEIQHSGDSITPPLINANQLMNYTSMAPVKVELYSWVSLLKPLFRVGEPIEIDTHVIQYTHYKGKYILGTSSIELSYNSQQWVSNIELYMIRSVINDK